MLSAALYQTFYLFLIIFLTIWISRQYAILDYMGADNRYVSNTKSAWWLTVFLMFFIGLRPIHYVFVDMVNYDEIYNHFFKGHSFVFLWNRENVIFDNMLAFFGSMDIPINFFFLVIAIVYFGGITLSCRKLFPDDTFLALLVYLGAFSTFSYGTNGIKAGVAASVFLIAVAFREKRLLAFAMGIISIGLHHSMVAPVGIFIISYFLRGRKYGYAVWVVSFLFAAFHITFLQELFRGMADEHGARYLQVASENRIVSGFRPDFIIYSFIPIFLGDYIMRRYEIESEEYNFIWNIYTLTNAVFLFCSYADYINRIAYLSWLIYPFVLIYPFLHFQWNPNQERLLKYTVYGHLGFTLFMSFVYYGM